MNIQTVYNVSDCVPLYLPHSLYLKPIAKFNASVALPSQITGKSISNYEVMEKMRQMILPDKFSILKVSKSTLEFIRFEGEIEERSKLKHILSRLDGRPIRLTGFTESVKIRASESKDEFPTRHDWDSFFRDARNMDEMKAGERPDTIHISNLPIKWFCPRHQENDDNAKPSESIFKRIFEKFGEVRAVDIPACDPYRSQMKAHMSGLQTFNYDQDQFFEGYVQFIEYLGFVRAMDEFRGMKLVKRGVDKSSAISIAVDFDKSKHLSDASVKKRKIVRDRFMAKDREKEEEEKKRLANEEAKKEKERKRQEALKQAELEKQRQREQKRKEKHLQKLRAKETDEMTVKIRSEERKLLMVQRKLEGIRLLDALFERMKTKSTEYKSIKAETSSKSDSAKRMKETHENEYRKMKDHLRKVKDGKMLKNFLGGDRDGRSPSINTISSNDSILNDDHDTISKKKKKKRDLSSSSSNSSDSGSEEEKRSEKKKALNTPASSMPPMMHPGAFPPMYNPETGEYMSMYPYPYPYAAPYAPGFFPNPMTYRPYRGGPRGRYPRGQRGSGYRGRGRGGYYDGDGYKYNKYDEYDEHDEHDRRRSHSRSRSRSRSRSHRRSRSRSRRRRTRSRSRSRSRSRRSSRSRSKSRSNRKLASTLRRSHSPRSSRSKSWSSDHSRKRSKRRSRRRTWSRDKASPSKSVSPQKHKINLQPEKLMRSAKEIQRSVQLKLQERMEEEESMKKSILEVEGMEKYQKNNKSENRSHSKSKSKTRTPEEVSTKRTFSKSRSLSSEKFMSPKRKPRSETPEKDWSKNEKKNEPIFS